MNNRLFPLIILLFKEPSSGTVLSGEQWEKIVHILRQTQLLATLTHIAKRYNVFDSYPSYAKKNLLSADVYAYRQAQQVIYESKEISQILSKGNIQPIFLKGASYTLSGSNNGKGRIYSDIDLLVKKSQIINAQELLSQTGWLSKKLNDYDERYYREWAHEIPPMSNIYRGTVIDVHHNLIPPISGRAPDPKLFFNQIVYTENNVAYLLPEAATLHSCIHLFSNEDFTNSFRDLIDLFLLIQEYGSIQYWEKLYSLAHETGFTLELYYCVESLKLIFNVDIPGDIQVKLSNKHQNLKTKIIINFFFKLALCPHHPLIFKFKNKLADFFVYLRGHWIKMPTHILLTHLSIKSFFTIRDWLFGKHQFDKKV